MNFPPIICIGNAIEALIEFLKEYQGKIPSWLASTIEIVLYIAIALTALWLIIHIVGKIIRVWKDDIAPLFYSKDEKIKRLHRQRFADHIEGRIRDMNSREDWQDYRYAELEAEVEIELRSRSITRLKIPGMGRPRLQRTKSLSKALKASSERVLLLEGAPGSGKSVALRHITQAMAKKNIKSRNLKSIIPIYINLKELRRSPEKTVDSNLIRSFVIQTIRKANNRDAEEYFENEFENGLINGTWLFLFDSFDEIPEVLSSSEMDAVIRKYAYAIHGFLHGMNKCRAVIASRHFRSPGKGFEWPTFRILPLSDSRKTLLVEKSGLNSHKENEILAAIGAGTGQFTGFASNPMFLRLLCEYLKQDETLPANPHHVFEHYIEKRFERDRQRVRERFSLEQKEIRQATEQIAFCMIGDTNLGLSPTRVELKQSLRNLRFEINSDIDNIFGALEFMKLARFDTSGTVDDDTPFTFSHRRFQEYFATCLVMQEPDRVSTEQLLLNPRWRDTAVVVCQSQDSSALENVISKARQIIEEMVGSCKDLIENPLQFVTDMESPEQDPDPPDEPPVLSKFDWPERSLHLFSLLQDGFALQLDKLPDDIRLKIARIILTASASNTYDCRLAMEIAGTVPSDVLQFLVKENLGNNSALIRDMAFQQVSKLGRLSDETKAVLRKVLVENFKEGRFLRDYRSSVAYLSRLDDNGKFVSIARLLTYQPIIHLGLVSALTIAICTLPPLSTFSLWGNFGLASIIILICLITLFFARNGRYKLLYTSSIYLAITFIVFGMTQIWPLMDLTSKDGGSVLLPLEFYILALYAATWYLSSLNAVTTGSTTQPLWWPIIPAIPLYTAIRDGLLWKEITKALLFPFKRFRVFAKNVAYFIVIILLGVAFFITALLDQQPLVYIATWNQVFDIDWLIFVLGAEQLIFMPVFSITLILFGIILLIAFALIVFIVANRVLIVLKETAKFLAWIKSTKAPLTYPELLEILSRNCPLRIKIWYLHHIRRKSPMRLDHNTISDLRSLILAYENARVIMLYSKKMQFFDFPIQIFLKPTQVPTSRDIVSKIRKHYIVKLKLDSVVNKISNLTTDHSLPDDFVIPLTQYSIIVYNLRAAFLDELFRLLDYVRSKAESSDDGFAIETDGAESKIGTVSSSSD